MKRARLPLLAVLPVSVISFVIAVPFVAGDHPLRWESGSLLPDVVLNGEDAGKSKAPSDGTAAGTSTPATAEIAKVTKEWKEGMPQWGVQLYWEDNPEHALDYVEKQAKLHSDYLVGLHANSVSVSFPSSPATSTPRRSAGAARRPPPSGSPASCRSSTRPGCVRPYGR